MAMQTDTPHGPDAAPGPDGSVPIVRTTPPGTPPVVAGILCPAGGLASLEAMLRAAPTRPGLAVVVLYGGAPEHPELLTARLSRQCRLAVRVLRDGEAPQPSQVYLVPPDKTVLMRDGRLRLVPMGAGAGPGDSASLDPFLRSLAANCGPRAVAVALHGSGARGLGGLDALVRAGGLCIAQDPVNLDGAELARLVIEAGLADKVLQAEGIMRALMEFAARAPAVGGDGDPRPVPAGAPGRRPDRHLREMLSLLRAYTRSDFRHCRTDVIARRIRRRMDSLGLDDARAYLQRLRTDLAELERLREDLLTGIGAFFRDPEAFRVLDAEALAALLAERPPEAPLRIWVPGCGTGEEAYGIAILLHAALEARGRRPDAVRIFATDIDDAALRYARRGAYPVAALRNISLDWRARYFEQAEAGVYRVCDRLREQVLFASHNLVVDAPFARLDLVSCRNVLDLLDGSLREHALRQLHAALRPNGWLFLGSEDAPVEGLSLFESVARRWRLYRRLAPTGVRPGVAKPPASASGPAPASGGAEARRGQTLDARAQALLRDCFVPPCALIDQAGQVQYLHGAVGDYLRLPPGMPTRSLWSMARPGLVDAIRAGVARSQRTGETASIDAMLGEAAGPAADGAGVWVRIEVRPLGEQEAAPGLLLVSFRDLPWCPLPRVSGGVQPDADAAVGPSLQDELKATRADLSQTIAALERANDELQNYNEELMSANEELRAANNELEAAKSALQAQVREADRARDQLESEVAVARRANDDINNLLTCTQMATIFVDPQLRIKLATAAASRVLPLREQDIGRPLPELSQAVPDATLLEDCRAVLAGAATRERELLADDGACFLRRIQPYRTAGGGVDGAVIGYMDITHRAANERLLREREEHYRTLFDNSPICLLEQDWSGLRPLMSISARELSVTAQTLGDEPEVLAVCRNRVRLTAVNEAGRRLLELDGASEEEALRFQVGVLPSSCPETFGAVVRLFAEGRMSAHCEDELITPRGNRVPVLCHFVRLPDATNDGGNALRRVLVAVYDIRERKALQSAVVASEQRLRRALHVVHEGVWDFDVRNGHLWWSAEYARMWGAPPPTASTTYDWLLDRIHPEDRADVQAGIRAAIEGDGERWQAEYRCKRADGTYANVLDRGAITRDGEGRVVRMLGCMLDITDLKQAQQELHKREQRLRSVLDAAADAIITVNSKARILSFNPAAEAMFGRESREIMGQGIGQLFAAVGGRLLSRDLAGEATDPAAHDGGPRLMEGLRGDGEPFPVEVSVRPVEGSALFVILARDLSEQRRLEREIIEMSTRQQQEIGREIHDGLGQELTALLMLASGMERKLGRADAQLTSADFAKMTQYLKRALDTARSLSKGLAPADIASEGLPAALEDLADRMQAATGLEISFSCAGDIRVEESNRAAHLYRIAQEALSNAVRHADATRLEVGLEATSDGLLLSVRDNGKGIPADAERNGRLGLHLMRYRASILGGECTIAANATGGTLVRCEVPMRAGSGAA